MPRPPRPDFFPEIELPDTKDDHANARRAVSAGRRVGVYDPSTQPVDTYFKIFDDLGRILDEHGHRLDGVLLLKMLLNVDMARIVPKSDPATKVQIRRDKHLVWELRVVGCRLTMDQNAIAVMGKCSREHVNRQISIMKEIGLIVNQGRGWYEFNSGLVWRGRMDIAAAYQRIQPTRDGLTIIQNGIVAYQFEQCGGDNAEV